MSSNPYKKEREIIKKSPGGTPREVPPVVEEPVVVVDEITPTTTNKKNLLDGLIEKKDEGKSYGFYLSNEAVSKLEKLAKQNKCSKSKALDTLLRSLL